MFLEYKLFVFIRAREMDVLKFIKLSLIHLACCKNTFPLNISEKELFLYIIHPFNYPIGIKTERNIRTNSDKNKPYLRPGPIPFPILWPIFQLTTLFWSRFANKFDGMEKKKKPKAE